MIQKPKKYPFYTRLKKAWKAYNEYMPTTPVDVEVDTDISWYKEARNRNDKRKGDSVKPIAQKHILIKRKDKVQ